MDPKQLAERLARELGPAIEAATRMADAQKVVASILERSFDKETLDAIYLVMRGPDAISEIPHEQKLSAIHKACNTLDAYHRLITDQGRMQ